MMCRTVSVGRATRSSPCTEVALLGVHSVRDRQDQTATIGIRMGQEARQERVVNRRQVPGHLFLGEREPALYALQREQFAGRAAIALRATSLSEPSIQSR
jgi:hypothetical protein